MTRPECLAFEQAVFGAGDGAVLLKRRPDLAAHHAECLSCRRWLEAFTAGTEAVAGVPAFAAGVMARTAATACARARELSASAFDAPLPAVERSLVEAHLEICAGCRAVVAEMVTAMAALPALAEAEPGPWFAARVLAATSGRPAPAREAWRRRWAALVSRPRFAIEAAYALTLCLVLVTGNPLSALEWTAARVEPLVERVETPIQAIDVKVRAWRHRTALGADAPKADVPGARTSWSRWIGKSRGAVFQAWSGWFSRVVAGLRSLLAQARRWGLELLERARTLVTEPHADSARFL